MPQLPHFSYQAALATHGALISTTHTRADHWPAIWSVSQDLLVIADSDGR